MSGRRAAGMRLPLLFMGLAMATGCRKSVPPVPRAEETALAPLEIKKGASWLFTYLDANGAFSTTDKAEEIPPGAQRVVRVVDPSKGDSDRRDTTNVYVVDVRE